MNKKSFPGVGSSPLTRGTLMKLVLLLRSKRFIPAYAGNSLFTCRKITTFTVHPRLRGELDISFRFSSMKFGSSPLTRGTHVFEIVKQKRIRFIPAYAGNSSEPRTAIKPLLVHPRLRGELLVKDLKEALISGSSPLTRGTLEY